MSVLRGFPNKGHMGYNKWKTVYEQMVINRLDDPGNKMNGDFFPNKLAWRAAYKPSYPYQKDILYTKQLCFKYFLYYYDHIAGTR